MSTFLAAVKQREREIEIIHQRMRQDSDFVAILSEARENKHKNAQDLIEQQRAFDQWSYERAVRETKYMSMPVEVRQAKAVKEQRLPSLSPSRADSMSPSPDPSAGAPWDPSSPERSSAPARVGPRALPPALQLAGSNNQQQGSQNGADVAIFYPWEVETPKFSSPNLQPVLPNRQAREGYETPPPSTWNMDWWRRQHPGAAGPGEERLGSAGLFNMLQGVKDEGGAQAAGRRPYEPNLHVPLGPGRAVYAYMGQQHDHARRSSYQDSPKRTRWVWKPRHGFPGALAQAPAGYKAMLEEVQGSFPVPPVSWAPVAKQRPATAEPLTTTTAAGPAQDEVSEPLHRRVSAVPEGFEVSGSGRLLRSLSAEPLVPLPAQTEEQQEEQQQQEQEQQPQDKVPLPPISSPRPPSAGHHSSGAGSATSGPTRAARTAGERKAILQSAVWVGARGRVVNGRVVP